MSDLSLPPETVDASGKVWPDAAYWRQIEQLKAALGKEIYLAEVRASEINLSVTIENRAFELLDVIEFPRPDPARGIFPHLLLLDDGRGINMGQIARVSFGRPFQPADEDILYQDENLLETLLYCERSLSRDKVAAISRQSLGAILAGAKAQTAPELDGAGSNGLPDVTDQTSVE